MKNVLFYCEQIYGTGHFSRTVNIIEAFLETNEVNIYLIFGGRIPEGKSVPDGITFLNITEDFPSSKAESLLVDTKKLTANRMALIHNFISKIETLDNLYLEFYPFGRFHLSAFFRFTIDLCKSWHPNVFVTSYIRDVMDIPEKNRDKNISDAIKYFDQIIVCGEKEKNEVFIGAPEFSILDPIVKYVGYVVPNSISDRGDLIPIKRNRMIVSAGGGEDGNEVIKRIIGLLAERFWVPVFEEVNVFLPSKTSDAELLTLISSSGIENLYVHRYSSKFKSYLEESEIHICMGGYNTIFESIALGVGLVVVPRVWESEQCVRLNYLSSHYNCKILSDDSLSAHKLEDAINEVRNLKWTGRFELMGARAIVECVKDKNNHDGKNDKIELFKNCMLFLDEAIFPGFKRMSLYISIAKQLARDIEWSREDVEQLYLTFNKNELIFFIQLFIPSEFRMEKRDFTVKMFNDSIKWYRSIFLINHNGIMAYRSLMTVMDTLIYFEAKSAFVSHGLRK
ncbi:glycosyltransferase [Cellvibrio sp. NN19]|uniref:glycosyltransferase n=1 Tax=Cellvibrio chitinivorans TaxID=3102792 RepID=UPI002B409941|nr:glycosyltransferase [Cellvibrio sp. NN19]